MDGVQADFFGAWAKWYSNKTGKQITSYRDIGDAEAQLASIMELTNSSNLLKSSVTVNHHRVLQL